MYRQVPILALLALSSASLDLTAATYTWDGGGANDFWTTGQNWVGDSSPPNDGTEDVVFQSDQGTSDVYPWQAGAWSVNSFTINSTGGQTTPFTFQGGDLTIGSGGLTNNGLNWQTFNENVIIGADQTWTLNMVTKFNEDLNINGNTLTINGSSSAILKTWNSGANITGGGTINLNTQLEAENDNSGWTGSMNINSGAKLTIVHNSGLGTTANGTTVASGGQLVLNKDSSNIVIGAEALSLAGTGYNSDGTGALRSIDGDNSISGTVTLTANTEIAVDADSLTLSGIISDGGSNYDLTSDGSGKLVLSADNTYGGDTNISSGTLEIQHQDALGDLDNGTNTTTTITSGATFALNNASAMTISDEDFTIAGTGVSSAGAIDVIDGSHTISSSAITMSADATIDVSNSDDTLTLSSSIGDGAGDYDLTKTGAGTLVLSSSDNDNNWNGDLNINAGTVSISNFQHLAQDLTTNPLVTVASGATFKTTGSTFFQTNNLVDFNIAGTGTASNGAMELDGGGTYRGVITLSADATIDASGAGSILRFQDDQGGSVALGSNDLTVIVGANNIEMDSPLTGSGNLIVQGTGSLIMQDTTTWTGDLYIEDTATWDADSSNQISDSADVYVRDGATFQLDFNAETIDQLNLQGGATVTNNDWNDLTLANTAGNAIAVTGGASDTAVISMTDESRGRLNLNGTATTIDVASGKTLRVDGGIENGSLTKTGDGTLTFGNDTNDAPNYYTGGTTVSGGTLLLSRNDGTDALANQTITVNTGAVLQLDNHNQINDSADLILSGGTFHLAGYDETLDNLTLTAHSVINLGTGDGTHVDFTGTVTGIGSGASEYELSIWNWSGNPYGGDSIDSVFLSGTTLDADALANIKFYKDSGTTLWGGNPYQIPIAVSGEVLPAIPEPSTWLGGLGVLLLSGWHWRKRIKG